MSITDYVKRQKFHPTFLGVLVNPYFIVRYRIDRSVKAIGQKSHGRLLDFGCGSRPYEHHFVNVTEYIGMDIEVSGHPDEKKRADIYYDGKTVPFEDDTFDVVFSSEVFEHVFNADELFAEIARVLKPGGALFLTLPFAFPEHEQPYDFARYTQFGITSVLERAGLTVTSIEKNGNMIHAIGQLINAYFFGVTRRSKLLQLIVQIVICAPVTILTELMAKVLPRDDRFYCGLVVHAKA